MSDPIVQLLRDIAAEGRPSLAWSIEWAGDGDLQRAWDHSASPFHMALLLGRLGFIDSARFVEDEGASAAGTLRYGTLRVRFLDGEVRALPCALRAVPGARYEMDPTAAAQLRAWVPRLVTLAELFAMLDARNKRLGITPGA
jgi:hypothetical protein